MADKKISALTAASTPLAGTEELPIVQSGTTKKVSVNNLTAGKAVSASSLTATNIKTSPATANLDISETTVAADGSDANININVTPKGTGFLIAQRFNSDSLIINASTSSTTYGAITVNGDIATYANGKLKLGPDQGGGVELYYDGSGDLYITPRPGFNSKFTAGNLAVANGNLVIGTSGKGIDFSADGQAAGMTSELLDDYEEGTFTATMKGSTSDPTTPVTATGQYTKIGDTVNIWVSFANVDTTGASGAVTVAGLPFTSGSVRSVGSVLTGQFPLFYDYTVSYLGSGSATASFNYVQTNGYGDSLQHSAGSGRYLEFSLTYKV